jgi:hypothetical protein
MPRIQYYICTRKRCRKVLNRSGNELVAYLTAEEAILSASVKVSDGYRCPNCAPVGRRQSRFQESAPGLAGELYPTEAAVAGMLPEQEWITDLIAAEYERTNPAWYMPDGIYRKGSVRRRPTAKSRPALTSAQQAALRALLSNGTPAETEVDSLSLLLG